MNTEAKIKEVFKKSKIQHYIQERNSVRGNNESQLEFWFFKYTHADKALVMFNNMNIENDGRESIDKRINVAFKFRIVVYIPLNNNN
jgi:hypothetical protein